MQDSSGTDWWVVLGAAFVGAIAAIGGGVAAALVTAHSEDGRQVGVSLAIFGREAALELRTIGGETSGVVALPEIAHAPPWMLELQTRGTATACTLQNP